MRSAIALIVLVSLALLFSTCSPAEPTATPAPPTATLPPATSTLALPTATPNLATLGRKVDIGGFSLYTRFEGEGQPGPLVILEHGAGGVDSTSWGKVPAAVGGFAPVMAYDRAGNGQSEAGPTPRCPDRMAQELHALLATTQMPPPYVLVGHSYGGFVIRSFASQYPAEVAGLVFVDGMHEDYDRLLAERGSTKRVNGVPCGEDGFEQMRKIVALPDVPAVILSSPQWAPGWAPELLKAWVEYQGRWLEQLPQGKQIIAEKSGHMIQRDEPQIVIDAIREVVEAARKP